jgi:hypothetical protein
VVLNWFCNVKLCTETSSLNTLKIMPRNLNEKLYVHEFGFSSSILVTDAMATSSMAILPTPQCHSSHRGCPLREDYVHRLFTVCGVCQLSGISLVLKGQQGRQQLGEGGGAQQPRPPHLAGQAFQALFRLEQYK